MKQATITLIKLKSCNILLHMLLVCIHSYLQSILRYKFLILGTYHPDTTFMWARMWGTAFIFWGQNGPASTPIFKSARVWGSVAIFLSQKGSVSKVWETLAQSNAWHCQLPASQCKEVHCDAAGCEPAQSDGMLLCHSLLWHCQCRRGWRMIQCSTQCHRGPQREQALNVY